MLVYYNLYFIWNEKIFFFNCTLPLNIKILKNILIYSKKIFKFLVENT